MKLTPRVQTAVMAAALAGGVTLFTAAAVQQNYRLSANDPQIQLATDAAAAVAGGVDPASVVGESNVNAESSLAPFVTVFDSSHTPVATSGRFNGQTLTPPAGTFAYAQAHGQERFTWQTSGEQREAAILVYQSGSHPAYILAARNIIEVERREDALRLMALVTLCGIGVVTLAYVLLPRPPRR